MKSLEPGSKVLVAARHFVDEGYEDGEITALKVRQSYIVTVEDYDDYDGTYLVAFDVGSDDYDCLWIDHRYVRPLSPSVISVKEGDVDTDSRLSEEDRAIIKEYIYARV